MSAEWQSYPTANAAAEACSQRIVTLLEGAVPGSGSATLAISGGSTPKLMFAHLVQAKMDWSRVHLFWVDERAVPPTDEQSNFRLADEHLIKPGRLPQRNIHRICAELPPEKAAKRYAAEITEFFQLEPGELPHFDVLHLGTGSDAHTASLFPGEPLIENRQEIAAAVYVAKIPQWRITLLPGALLAARHCVFLVAGEDKADAVHNIFRAPYEPKKYPAQLLSKGGRKVTWYIDTAAARLLTLNG
jgi:6-phosphogluconolactonase